MLLAGALDLAEGCYYFGSRAQAAGSLTGGLCGRHRWWRA